MFKNFWTQTYLNELRKQQGPDTRKRKLEARNLAMMAGPHLDSSYQLGSMEFLEVAPDCNDPLSGATWIIQIIN